MILDTFTQKQFLTDKGNIHYWINGVAESSFTLVFMPGLTASLQSDGNSLPLTNLNEENNDLRRRRPILEQYARENNYLITYIRVAN